MSAPNSTPPPAADLVGGRYRILDPIGEGAMGQVFKAEHYLTGQVVALKVLPPHVAKAGGGVTRFLREVRAAHAVSHPGVVPVYDAGDHNDGLYIAMELLEGESLGERMAAGAEPHVVLAVLRAVLEPLAAAHSAGIVHRDLKPDNIFIAQGPEGDEVRLLDFGIAADQAGGRATQTGLTVGTPFYMSPEQALDPRTCKPSSDVWAVGTMIYEALAGEVPFGGETPSAVLVKAIYEPHPPLSERAPGTPAPLAALVDRCLSKEQAERPADARALADALDAIDALWHGPLPVARRPSSTTLPTPGTLSAPMAAVGRPRRWPWLVAAALLVLGGLGYGLSRRGTPAAPAAAVTTPDAAVTAGNPPPAAPATEAPAAPTHAPATQAPAAPATQAPAAAAPSVAPPEPVAVATEPPKPKPKARRARRPKPKPKPTARPADDAPAAPASAVASAARPAPPPEPPVAPPPEPPPAPKAAPATRAPAPVERPASKAAPVTAAPKAPASKAPATTAPFMSF